MRIENENIELFQVTNLKDEPVWSNKDYEYLNKKAKFISEFILNQRSGRSNLINKKF